MKRFLPLLFCCSAQAVTFDDIVEYIDETFDVSATTDKDGDYYFTLNASHQVNDTWRVFGEYDTNHNYELGVGYSFFTSFLYNELYVKAANTSFTTSKPYVGLFSATVVGETVLYTNLETGYATGYYKGEYIDVDYEGIDFNKSIGALYDVTDWMTIGYSFNHDKTWHRTEFERLGTTKFNGAMQYQDISATFDIKGVKPSVTYTFGDTTKIEFGFKFDF